MQYTKHLYYRSRYYFVEKIYFDDLVKNNNPIIYYNRNKYPSIHLDYERKRLKNMAKILKTVPKKSYLLGDFIMELIVFNKSYLSQLNQYIERIYKNGWKDIVPKKVNTLLEKLHFSEWAIYAIFLIDILNVKDCKKMSTEKYLSHIHSENYYKRYKYDSKIVHFVVKTISKEDIKKNILFIL
ncbi:MAG: hypothetical protein ACOX3T_02035 [Bdellovibrionota bacterium]